MLFGSPITVRGRRKKKKGGGEMFGRDGMFLEMVDVFVLC